MRTLAIALACVYLLCACGQGAIEQNNTQIVPFVFIPRTSSEIKWVALSTDTQPNWQGPSNIIKPENSSAREYHFDKANISRKYSLAYLEQIGASIKLNIRHYTNAEYPTLNEQRFFNITQTNAGISGTVTLSQTGSKAIVTSSGNYPQSNLSAQNNNYSFAGANQISDIVAMEYLEIDTLHKVPLRFYIDRQLNTSQAIVQDIDFNSTSGLQNFNLNVQFPDTVTNPTLDARFRSGNGAELNGLYNSSTRQVYLPASNLISTDLYYVSARFQTSQGSNASGFDAEHYFSVQSAQDKNINFSYLALDSEIALFENQLSGLNDNTSPDSPPLLGWNINLAQTNPINQQSYRMEISVSAGWLAGQNNLQLPRTIDFGSFGATVQFDPDTPSNLIITRINGTHADALLSSFWHQGAQANDKVERVWNLKEVFLQ